MSDPGPVTGAERIGSLDVLRGVAILGILVMNIYAFAMPFPGAYMNPLLMGGTDQLNIGTWMVTHVVFDQKFLSIFAMLFGAGIVLMTSKAAQSGKSYGRLFFRRQSWLILFGALHSGPRLIGWAIFATLAGLLMGGLFLWTGGLLAPILAHALINGIQLWRMAEPAGT